MVSGVVLAPNGQLPYRWPSITVQSRQKILDHEHETRRRRATEYWASEDQDTNHYSIDEYEVYLATGSWNRMRETHQARLRQLAKEEAENYAERQRELQCRMEEKHLAKWLLPSHLIDDDELEYLDDSYGDDTQDDWDDGFVSDPEDQNDDYE